MLSIHRDPPTWQGRASRTRAKAGRRLFKQFRGRRQEQGLSGSWVLQAVVRPEKADSIGLGSESRVQRAGARAGPRPLPGRPRHLPLPGAFMTRGCLPQSCCKHSEREVPRAQQRASPPHVFLSLFFQKQDGGGDSGSEQD